MQISDTHRTPRNTLQLLFGMSETTFAKLKNAGVFVAHARGVYDLKESIHAYVDHKANAGVSSDLTEERRLLTIAQRQRIEHHLDVDVGRLVPLEDAAQAFQEAMFLISTQMDGLPGRVAGELAGLTDPASVRALLLKETRRIRDEAATTLERWAIDRERSKPAETATVEDGGSMGGSDAAPAPRKRRARPVAQ